MSGLLVESESEFGATNSLDAWCSLPHTMPLTDFHAKYLAFDLTRRHPSGTTERVANVVAGAQVDLNPHQVEAAVFAFRSPLSRGALLADEVGLGKTIEAGLVIAQRWAERRRRLLVITPANLRKQWHQELTEKFLLPGRILESRSYNEAVKSGVLRPFDSVDSVAICSYQFARAKAADIQQVPWDLVVVDEAHRLRNVYKPGNVIANTLKLALARAPKLFLTATPLQNSLLELFGLVSFVDEHAFGDLKSFREQFGDLDRDGVYEVLKQRLRPVCHRTLRRQVEGYVPYTRRLPMLEEFTPEESEDRLYALVSEYLRRDNLKALPPSQRALMTLVLRKLLASSSFAIAGALVSMASRLRELLGGAPEQPVEDSATARDYEAFEATAEEWTEPSVSTPTLTDSERAAVLAEIGELEQFAKLATSISHNAKGKALVKALAVAFKKAEKLGAAQKAIIFTESRRTQDYLLRLLADSPFSEGIVLFNGSNTDERSRAIYAEWLARHAGTDRVTGSRTADIRSALVDYFREQGHIMIATEAGAEGINLQFCSLVVNYDLPWNPQRIEQRIGRCHRYGQTHDVVVVNFLNRKNEADRRVFQLLSEKFQLFEGVFGASDEVLGAIESGVDFERRVAGIYQSCRKPEEIRTAFEQLQLELGDVIAERMSSTRRQLLEHFDDEVRDRLRVRNEGTNEYLSNFERSLMALTRHELGAVAQFDSESSFHLERNPFGGAVPLGRYELPRRSREAHLYRLGHPLADAVIASAKGRELEPREVVFDYRMHTGKITTVEPLLDRCGWLLATVVSVAALEQAEDHIVLSAVGDDGEPIEQSVAERLFTLPGRTGAPAAPPRPEVLARNLSDRVAAIEADVAARNGAFFEAEVEKLESWTDDLKAGLERELKDLDRAIKEARKAAKLSPSLEEKLAGQRRMKALDAQRKEKRRSLFAAQDELDQQRDELIAGMEARLNQTVEVRELFAIRWTVA